MIKKLDSVKVIEENKTNNTINLKPPSYPTPHTSNP